MSFRSYRSCKDFIRFGGYKHSAPNGAQRLLA
jgi:hypothetical protein